MAYRVVADHIRTLSFAIADGSCPGKWWKYISAILRVLVNGSLFCFVQMKWKLESNSGNL